MRYVVSYDLRLPERSYERLWAALSALGAKRILQSQWIFRRSGTTSSAIRDHLMSFIDSNDRLLVMGIDVADAAWFNPIVDPKYV